MALDQVRAWPGLVLAWSWPGCHLVSVWVAVKCGSGHTHFKLKSWVWVTACGWVRVPSGVGVVAVKRGSEHTNLKLKS